MENGHKTNDKNAFIVTILRDNKAAMGGDGLDTTGCPKTVPGRITKSRFELHYLF